MTETGEGFLGDGWVRGTCPPTGRTATERRGKPQSMGDTESDSFEKVQLLPAMNQLYLKVGFVSLLCSFTSTGWGEAAPEQSVQQTSQLTASSKQQA